VVNYIAAWGYPAILIGILLGNANIPVPSELILGFAGYLVFREQLDFSAVVWAGLVGGLLGSILSYWVGYYGGPPFVARYGKYLLLSTGKMRLAERWFEQHGLLAVLFGRLLPVIRTFISLPAGFARMNFTKFVIYTVLGSLPWTIALVYAGMILGEKWQTIHSVGRQATMIIAVVLVVAVVFFLLKNRTRQ
jgi:membrane protein DedA with SNARE-associated domain